MADVLRWDSLSGSELVKAVLEAMYDAVRPLSALCTAVPPEKASAVRGTYDPTRRAIVVEGIDKEPFVILHDGYYSHLLVDELLRHFPHSLSKDDMYAFHSVK